VIFVCCRLNYTQFPVCTTSIRDYYPQIPLHAVCSPLSITHRFLYTHIQPRTIGIIFTRRFHYTRFPLLTLSAFPFLSEICRLLKSRSTGYGVINNRLRKLTYLMNGIIYVTQICNVYCQEMLLAILKISSIYLVETEVAVV